MITRLRTIKREDAANAKQFEKDSEKSEKAAKRAEEKGDVAPTPAADGSKPTSTVTRVRKAAEPAHKKWNGFGATHLVRYSASKGLDKAQTKGVVSALLGVELNDTTLNIQYRNGVKGTDVPVLTKEQAKEFAAATPKAVAAPKKAAKGKAVKAEPAAEPTPAADEKPAKTPRVRKNKAAAESAEAK